MNRRIGLLVVIVVATLLYLPSLRNGFAYDDVAVIQLDERVHSLRDWRGLVLIPYWHDKEMGLYRPLVTISYAVDWTVSGGSAFWFHAVNLVWNAAACGALFLLLAALAPLYAALAGALLFALHPLHTEAVANVVGRAELMAAAFSLAALYLWVKRTSEARSMRGTVAIVATLFALAVLSKESAIMLPVLLVLVEIARGALPLRDLPAWLRRNLALVIVLGVVGASYLLARTLVLGDLGPTRLAAALEPVNAIGQRFTALQIWPLITRLMLFPRELLPDYAPRIIMPAPTLTPNVLLGALILLGFVIGGLVAWWRGQNLLALTLLWLPVALLPVSNLIIMIGVLLAERALYLPSAAFAFAVTLAFARIHEARARRLAYAAAVLVGVLFTIRTSLRIPEWDSTDSVFAALARDRPDSYSAQWFAARTALREGDRALALERYRHALTLWPHRRGLVIEAAGQAVQAGDLAFARQITGFMLERWPGDVEAAQMHAGTAIDMGDTTAARITIESALRRKPTDSLLLRMRAAIARDTAS